MAVRRFNPTALAPADEVRIISVGKRLIRICGPVL